jgi:hypothetical protein
MMPVRTFTITIDKTQRQELLDELQSFADKHEAKYTYSDYGTPDHFLVAIYGEEILITAADVPGESDVVDISFSGQLPGHVPDEQIVDEWLNDLKSFISKIPNVIISEERKSLRVRMDKSQRNELFAQMQKLADEHSLEFTLSFWPDKTIYAGEIQGEGFHITGDLVAAPEGEILITFFIDYHTVPTSTSLEEGDKLFNELKSLLSENPNVTIIEEK